MIDTAVNGRIHSPGHHVYSKKDTHEVIKMQFDDVKRHYQIDITDEKVIEIAQEALTHFNEDDVPPNYPERHTIKWSGLLHYQQVPEEHKSGEDMPHFATYIVRI
jgi:hypothetical protein